jgi:AcrR family transcriptional regulator
MEGEASRRLPAGPHGIPAELVARNQRERLIAAIAEACAERGYADISVADVASRAGVSTVTFYRQFADKRECMLAAHRALLGRLLEEVDRACEATSGEEARVGEEAESEGGSGIGEYGDKGQDARVRAAIHTTLSLLAVDAPSARLLTVEILAVGPEGMKRHDAAVEAFAARLGVAGNPDDDASSEGGPRRDSPLPHADWALVAGIFALIGRLVMAGEASRLPELEDALVATISSQS